VAVRAGTVVTFGVERSSTERAEWTSGFDESNDGDRESGGQLARETDAERGVFFERLHRHIDRLFGLVHRDGDVARDEVSFVFGLQGEVLGEVPGTAEFLEDLPDPFRERGELELLALHDDQTTSLSNLEEKEPVAHFAAHADHDAVGVGKDVVHEGLRPFSEPVLFTHSTIGVDPVKATALTEHGEMTVR
jgi:hypothetical protein